MSQHLHHADQDAAHRYPKLFAADAAKLRAQVDARLEQHFPQKNPSCTLTKAIRHSLLSPGKRIRPLITLFACRQSGGAEDLALDGACAVEMVHAASLIMDDLPAMDNAQTRRGVPTTHAAFGESAAMLATVALLNEAYRLVVANAHCSPEANLRALDHLTKAIGLEGLVGGQERDLAACTSLPPSHTGEGGLSAMQERHHQKTGALFAAAAAIGGEFAETDEGVIEALYDYGQCLGLAYQAFDDMIDDACPEKVTGKDANQDENKQTIINILGQNGARLSADSWIAHAAQTAEQASQTSSAPLSDLAHMVGLSFSLMTSADQ